MYSVIQDSTMFALLFWLVVLVVIAGILYESLLGGLNRLLRRGRREPGRTMSDRVATVRSRFEPEPGGSAATGTVFWRGELWTARCPLESATVLEIGDRVEIDGIDGLTAEVGSKVDARD